MEASYRVLQEGKIVASVSGNDDDRLKAEAFRYFWTYAEEGMVTMQRKAKTDTWRTLARARKP